MKVCWARGPDVWCKQGRTGRTSRKTRDSEGNGSTNVSETKSRCTVQLGEPQEGRGRQQRAMLRVLPPETLNPRLYKVSCLHGGKLLIFDREKGRSRVLFTLRKG